MEHTDCFHFPQITNKNSKFTFRRLQFSTFTTSSLHLWRSVDADFFISLAYVTSGKKSSFWFWYIPASMGLNTRKNMTFWPLNLYYRRSDWGTWLSETFPEALTSKLWNKKKIHAAEAYRNGAKLNYVNPPKTLSRIFDRSIYGIATWNSRERIKSLIPRE